MHPARRRDRLELLGFRGARGLFRSLPRPVALRAGSAIGDLLYLVDRRDRAVALLNLAIAFPEKSDAERRAILRASCRNLGRMVAEVCHFESLTPENLSRYVRIADPDSWRACVTDMEERGALVLTGHFGNWELLAYAHGLLGHPITLVHRPMHNRLVDIEIDTLRQRAGTRSIPKKAAAREAIRTLRAKGIVAIPFDQNQSAGFGVFVDFFGKAACTTFGLARLALLTGVPVYPVFLVREGESAQHRIEVLPAVEPVVSGDRDADVVATTQRYSDIFEAVLRRHPQQWIWFHKRWRTRPDGEPQFY